MQPSNCPSVQSRHVNRRRASATNSCVSGNKSKIAAHASIDTWETRDSASGSPTDHPHLDATVGQYEGTTTIILARIDATSSQPGTNIAGKGCAGAVGGRA